MNATDIFRGNEMAPNETILWKGRPLFRAIARDVFHVRVVAAYFVGLVALDAFQAWSKHLPLTKAIHDSVPLVLALGVAGLIVGALTWLTTSTTHFTITDRRVILRYGMAITATLSLPNSQIVTAEIAVNGDHSGDIPLTLKAGNHMPYLKLWPFARPWRLSHPQPMLRGVPRVAVVGALLARSIAASQRAEQARISTVQMPVREDHALEPARQLLSA